MNPLVPGGGDTLWAILAIASVMFALVALASLGRTRTVVGLSATLIWALAILLLPVLGAATWLIASRRLRRSDVRRRSFAAGVESP